MDRVARARDRVRMGEGNGSSALGVRAMNGRGKSHGPSAPGVRAMNGRGKSHEASALFASERMIVRERWAVDDRERWWSIYIYICIIYIYI